MQDLEYMRNTILENHPGIYNILDPNFTENLEIHYKTAHNRLITAQSDADSKSILKEFVAAFHDTHIQIGFFDQKQYSSTDTQIYKKFSIAQTDKDITLITLPTFEPNAEHQKELQKLYQELPLLRSAHILVFDLRGNSGGNSEFAKKIVTALFGAHYACTRINEMSADIVIDWRASTDNLLHLLKVKQENDCNFDSHDEFMQWLSSIIDGMQNALGTGQTFFTEKELSLHCTASDHATNPVRANIFVIIDHHCVSAALDFIDYLKAMQHSVKLIGETTKADSLYMEVRSVELPSKKGKFALPIKVYRNRPRGHNEPYTPDIYWDTKQDTLSLQLFISSIL